MKIATLLAAFFAASSVAVAFGQSAAAAAKPGTETSPPATETQPPPLPNTPARAVWADDLDDAKKRAREQGKVVFVEFTKNKCGNCFRMDGMLYPSVNFEMALLRMVPVKLDLDLAETARLAKRYNVDQVPAILVVSPGGALIFRMVGFESDKPFYVRLHNSMVDWDRLNLKIVHEPETINDPRAELALGKELFQRLDPDEAIPRFERAASQPEAPPSVREEALSYLASAQMELEQFKAARATIEKLLRIGKDPDRREKAELFRAQISIAEGKPEEARREFQAFLTRHPKSKYRDDAKAYLDRMKDAEGLKSQ